MSLPIVDAHLDLAYNVQAGRDLTLTAAEVQASDDPARMKCMVTLPELRAGGVALAVGSIFTAKRVEEGTEHDFDPETAARGKGQIDVYRSWEAAGGVRIIRSKRDLADHLERWRDDGLPGLLIAMEGAEPIRDPSELQWWFDAGLRMIGPAWGPTRYCGGFAGSKGVAGGFTATGRELLDAMKQLHIPLDVAHSSVELFMEGVESDMPHVVCTHTTPRELNGRDRMPNGEMLAALAKRGGIVGLGLGNIFLDKAWLDSDAEKQPVPLRRVGEVFELMAEHAGWDHVGIGSDLDGGIGVDESPEGLDTIADIGKISDVIPEHARAGVLGGNWLRFFGEALPD